MNQKEARRRAAKLLSEIAKANVKTHHLARDGNQLVNSKTKEVQVGISKKGSTGLVKITMPVDALPKEATKYGKKAAQAFHMTWLQFDIPIVVLKKAILARIKSKKTMYDFSKDVYGTEKAPCWSKTKIAKKTTKDKLKNMKSKKAKIAKEEKALKAEIRTRKTKKGSKTKVAVATA